MERECFLCGSASCWLVVVAVVAGGEQEALCLDCAKERRVLQWFAGEMEGRYWRDRWCVRVLPGAHLDQAAEVLADVLEGPVRRRTSAPAVAAGVGGSLVSPHTEPLGIPEHTQCAAGTLFARASASPSPPSLAEAPRTGCS